MLYADADVGALSRMLTDARARTLSLVADLTGEQLIGPQLAIVNPPLWEIGHLGWFQERWCLRYREGSELAPAMRADVDRLYDSASVPHHTRWQLPLPTLEATLAYLDAVLQRVLERLQSAGEGSALRYFAQLAALHEEMHCEALTYTRQTLAYREAPMERRAIAKASGAWPGEVELPGGEFMLGAVPGAGFVFDNEKWAHRVYLAPFRIARSPVNRREFLLFVEAGGYTRAELWSAEGWAWRQSVGARHPVYWRKQGSGWYERVFDTLAPLALDAPVMHVNWYEANAYCRWAGRRLPTEAEWEYAASTAPGGEGAKTRYPWGDAEPDASRANLFGAAGACVDTAAFAAGDSAWGCRQMIGNVWEWTADAFAPYPGFVADPYKEYSQPWFGDHKVLRGGAFATRAALIRNTWRNFYTPDRRDVFAGFRTCAA